MLSPLVRVSLGPESRATAGHSLLLKAEPANLQPPNFRFRVALVPEV